MRPGANHAGYSTLVTDEGMVRSFAASSAWDEIPPGFVGAPKWSETELEWLTVGIGRWGDSEFRTLEHLIRTMTPGTKGSLLIATELFPCKSCWQAILQFQHRTGIEVSVIYKTIPKNQIGKLGALFDMLT